MRSASTVVLKYGGRNGILRHIVGLSDKHCSTVKARSGTPGIAGSVRPSSTDDCIIKAET